MFKRWLACLFAPVLLTVAACGGGDEAASIEPLAVGSGTYFTDGNIGFADASASFYRVNEISGETDPQPAPGDDAGDAVRCPALFALDLRPDGVVLAVARRSAELFEADPRASRCKRIAQLPEVMVALAVRADGHLFAVSATHKLHALDSQAKPLAATLLQCPPNIAPCQVAGIDFAPDGTLYAIGPLGQWSRIDVSTAQLTSIRSGVAISDDFDIDAQGKVRGLAGGEFRSVDLAGNPTRHAINVFGGTAFATGVVHR